MELCVINVQEECIVSKYTPIIGLELPPPTPQEGFEIVPLPDGMVLQFIKTRVTRDENGNWVFEEDLVQKDRLWEAVRARRNEMLAASDWTQLKDVSVSGDWVAYRQALRDITRGILDPTKVVWPTAPSAP
jgi:hypothetical protein